MTLDVRTVFVMDGVFIAVTALTLVLLARTLPSDLRRSARTSALAAATLGVSWSLFAFRDRLPDLATILVANLLFLLGLTLIYQSVRLFDGLSPRRDVYLKVVAPTILVTLAARYAVDAYSVRVVVNSAGLAIMLALGARQLLAPVPAVLATPGRRIVGFWLLANTAILVLRIVVTAVRGGAPPLLANGPLTSLALAASLVTILGAIFAFFLLYTGRVTAELERQAHRDPLTDLLNRRAFEARGCQELERATRDGVPLSLLLLDADRFKAINDTWGHEAGDDALRAIAAGLRANLRPYDVIARLGGDEFAVMLPGLDAEDVRDLVPRLEAAISTQPFPDSEALQVSIGRATLDETHDDLRSLLARADRDLYRLKAEREGRGVTSAGGAVG